MHSRSDLSCESYIGHLARRIAEAAEETGSLSGPRRRLFLFYALAICLKGEAITPQDIRDAWAAWAESELLGTDSMILARSQLAEELHEIDSPDYYAALRVARERSRSASDSWKGDQG